MKPKSLDIALLAGARAMLSRHALEVPQRDDLCGAFCGALALNAAGIEGHAGAPLDQDAVALTAGSVISQAREPGVLPRGETGRRDYRLLLPLIEDARLSGTTVAGLRDAVERLSDGALVAIPYMGPWHADTLAALFDAAATLSHPVTLIANLDTKHLWGGRPSPGQLLDYLFQGTTEGPPPDWDVGHFACVFGRARGPRGSVYCLADTYPALGYSGVHLQPRERLAAALERRENPAGGVLAVVDAAEAADVRASVAGSGLKEGVWDNGTARAEDAR